MTIVSASEGGPAGLPQLQELSGSRDDPQRLALQLGGSLRLFVDVRFGPQNPEGYDDGLAVALAPLRNGKSHAEIGDEWMRVREGLPPGQVGPTARRFYDEHYNITASSGIAVPHAERGEPLGEYADRMASTVLRRHMPADTTVDLRAKHEVDAPGTRFYHLFPADNAVGALGWLARGRVDMAVRALENDQDQTMRFGYPPNFNARIALLRTQTPFDSYVLDALAAPELYGPEASRHFRDAQIRNLRFWNSGRHFLNMGIKTEHRRVVKLPTGEIGYRNWDDSKVSYKTREGLRPESAEEDWNLGEKRISQFSTEEEREAAWEKMVRSILASCESMQDQADYQFADPTRPETTRTTDILPAWLQANIAHKHKMVALSFEAEGNMTQAERHWRHFNGLKDLLNNRHWRQIDETHGHYTDLLTDGTQTGALNAAQILPLLVGDMVPYDRSLMIANTWRDYLLGDNGLKTSDCLNCEEQWSGKRDWPSLATWAMMALMQAAADAEKMGNDPKPFRVLADDIRCAARQGMQRWYDENHTIPERINDENPSEVATGGEYCRTGDKKKAQHGFGMSIGGIRVWEEVKPLEVELDRRRGSATQQVFAQCTGNVALANAAS